MTQNDRTLLRSFDKGAAKRGALLCWCSNETWTLKYVGPATNGGAGNFEWVTGPHKGTFDTYDDEDLRMAPMAWVEQKPVYKGDVLWWIPEGRRVEVSSCSLEHSTSWLVGTDNCNYNPKNLTWTQPTAKREAKLLAYLIDDQLVWYLESATFSRRAIRVPAEDKVIEI